MPDSMINGIINQNNSAEAHLEPMQINHNMPMNDNLLESINGPNDSQQMMRNNNGMTQMTNMS